MLFRSKCADKSDRTYLGEVSLDTQYTFSSDDVAKNVTFVCSVGGHCQRGQIVTFTNVAVAADDAAAYADSTPCGPIELSSIRLIENNDDSDTGADNSAPNDEDKGETDKAVPASSSISQGAATALIGTMMVYFSSLDFNF